MNQVRLAIALLSGLVLYNVFIYVGGFLAAVPVPISYFEYFGKEHNVLSLVVLDAFTFALPFFVIATIWSWITLRALAPARAAGIWCFGGLLLGWLYCEVPYILDILARPNQPPSPTLILASLLPPVWSILSILAFPLGIALATRLIITGEPACPALK